jgi:hypothetical protein
MFRSIFSILAGLAIWGCGADTKSHDGTTSGSNANDAVTKCKDFANTWCSQSLNCYAQVGRLASSQVANQIEGCNRVAVAAVPCDKAVAVDSSYDTCVAQVKAMPCSTWDVAESDLDTIRPPNSCFGVIKIQN